MDAAAWLSITQYASCKEERSNSASDGMVASHVEVVLVCGKQGAARAASALVTEFGTNCRRTERVQDKTLKNTEF